MKLIRKKTDNVKEEKTVVKSEDSKPIQNYPADFKTFINTESSAWKILIVDDEPDVHAITKLSLKNFSFAEKNIEFLNAMSGEQAKEILKKNPDVAAALIDVVMETEDAGLRLIKFIREELKNTAIRLIIRTGQPGAAPERYVIDHYDIDDYKDKTELIAQKLYTTVRSAIKAYRDISIINRNRIGLEKILNSSPQLYRIQPIQEFFEGVLTQMIGFCGIGDHNLISTINGFVAISESSKVSVRGGTGKFAGRINENEMNNIIRSFVSSETSEFSDSLFVPIRIHDQTHGFVYIENASMIREEDRHLINIMANQCAAALENLNLYSKLENANRLNEKKNQFLGMAAHDLRNPLAGISMATELLLPSLSNQDDLEVLNMIISLSQYAMELVSDLLDIAKIESNKLELELKSSDLSSIIKKSIDANLFMAEPKHIKLIFEPDETIPHLMIDPVRIRQVMINLVSNAVKYSNPDTAVNIVLKSEGNNIVIYVKDQGQGIPENETGKLFQPFVKTSVKSTGGELSTGLGLVICKKIVEAHGGKIWVESQTGQGSTFYVSLPLKNGKSE